MNQQPANAKNWAPFASSLAATTAAGFGAAQGITDTALSAHAAELAKNLKKTELLGVHVQMGKLHIALGVGGYPAGMAAAAISFNSSHNNWQEAVRNGNSEAQNGAVISMLGNSGFLASNSYGAIQTGMALKNVLATARNSPARIAAWAAAGTRLSTVFLRFNLAGILFTALELSGSWYYNRNNLSRHDYWLLSTPWGKEQDTDQCLSLPLDHYLDELHGHIQAPRMQIIPASNDAPRQFLLHFPMLSAAELTKPISSHASGARLNIGGYQLIREVQGRMGRPERWSPLSDALEDRLYIKQRDPLIVELTDLRGLIKSDLPRHTDIVLSIQLGHVTQEGHYDAHVYGVRFPVFDESGDFPTVNLDPQGEQCAHFNINPDLMPKVDK